MLAILPMFAACSGGGAQAGAPANPLPRASPTPALSAAPAATIHIAATDYFGGATIAATILVDGKPTATTFALASGLHRLQIIAPGFATYNGAIQVPGGATTRDVPLMPLGPNIDAWLLALNSDRLTSGSPPVQIDDALAIAAFNHAADMAVRNYFAHFDTHGFAPTTRSLLFGSGVMADENLAAGFSSVSDVESAFALERNALPKKSPADCAAYDALASHYCNLVFANHNWVGLAATTSTNSTYGTYFAQEFGDLYALVDATVANVEPSLGTTAWLTMGSLDGGTIFASVSTQAAPVPITIATLNADPACATQCPAADHFYPVGLATQADPALFSIPFALDQLYIPQAFTTTATFVGSSAASVYWPGGSVMPDWYGNASLSPLSITGHDGATQRERRGVVAPNAPRMRSR